jgi:hypothetical protein
MPRLIISFFFLVLAGSVSAQTPPAQPSSTPYYPAPPPERAPTIEQGAPLNDLSSPLAGGQPKVTRTAIDSETEARLFADAVKVVWGRHAKIKGAKPGTMVVTKQAGLWTVKGRVDSAAPGTEGDWAAIDGVVERISAGHIQVRGEVAFRVAKVQNGTPCKVAGTLNFRRSGRSQVWRLAEGDNPCDGAQELFDLVYEKPIEKKPVPTPPRRG